MRLSEIKQGLEPTRQDLPIEASKDELDVRGPERYVIAGIAQKAFLLERYDVTPDGDIVEKAIEHGLIVIK